MLNLQAFLTQNLGLTPQTDIKGLVDGGLNNGGTSADVAEIFKNFLVALHGEAGNVVSAKGDVVPNDSVVAGNKKGVAPDADSAGLDARAEEIIAEIEALDDIAFANAKVFEAFLKPLQISKGALKNIEAKLAALKIQSDAQGGLQNGGGAFLNLTPAQQTALQDKITALISGDDLSGDVDAFPFESVLETLPEEAAAIFQVFVQPPVQAKGGQAKNSSNSSLSPLVPDAQGSHTHSSLPLPKTSGTSFLSSSESGGVDLSLTVDGAVPEGFEGETFDSVMRDVSEKFSGKVLNGKMSAENTSLKPVAHSNTVKIPVFSMTGEGAHFDAAGISLDGAQYYAGSGLYSSQSAHNAVNPILSNSSAHSAHPASQTVAVHVAQAALQGQNKTMHIQLDPPELGRVEIKMSMDKDKNLKTVMKVEKPETLALLQKDQQVLEKALQEQGFDVADDAISFELAQDNQNFSQDGRHDGARNQARYGGDEDLQGGFIEIETSADVWEINPQTGYVSYDLLV